MKKRCAISCCNALPVLTLMLCIFLTAPPALANKNPYDWALVQLDYILKEKTDQLTRYVDKLHQAAHKAAKDKTVISFFKMNRLFFEACQTQKPPESLKQEIEKMRRHFNSHYIQEYFCFYDMLFVDADGIVFYTLRKEISGCMNLVKGENMLGPIEQALQSRSRKEMFIDYYEYPPSAEPAAFFIEPVFEKDNFTGWLILQCPVNKLNSIFSATDDLGYTGETFLVNRHGLMLTESYFKGQSTILKERLDDRNIKVKFSEKKGHREITDYRGVKALSSFEVFEFMGTRWLVVAKIDKDEITTQHYSRHKRYYSDQLMGWIERQPPATRPPIVLKKEHDRIIRVDMDEFLKTENNEILETWGVSTCTAFLAVFPEKFAYLAHISPKDRIYHQSDTDLLSQITKKMKNFDIYPFQRRDVCFIVIAPHFDGLYAIVNQLVKDGFFLSQIQVGYFPNARAAAVTFDYRKNDLNITWSFDRTDRAPVFQNGSCLFNTGAIIENIMVSENSKK